jgi:hypothetical protein
MEFRWNLRIRIPMIFTPITRFISGLYMKSGSRMWKFLWRLIIWPRMTDGKNGRKEAKRKKSNHSRRMIRLSVRS